MTLAQRRGGDCSSRNLVFLSLWSFVGCQRAFMGGWYRRGARLETRCLGDSCEDMGVGKST